MALPIIIGLEGPEITDAERDFLALQQPWGVILFARNIVDSQQLKNLNRSIRDIGVPHILVDQEGGRVQRLRPPGFQGFPAVGPYGGMAVDSIASARSEVRRHHLAMAMELKAHHFDIVCAPVLDVAQSYTHDVIGDRSFSPEPWLVAELGAVACEALMEEGLYPVLKHIPGHGRARSDSHLELPLVSDGLEVLSHDFLPFRELAHLPLAMTAHITYSAIDNHPGTQSAVLIDHMIRQQIGFGGLLMTDDLAMKALEGSLTEKASKSLDAGCDLLLYCDPDLDGCREIAACCAGMDVPPLAGL
ncbi:MAG TPA: beta-N-acetylhexosaminidase [Alphaproteobacteria bacterium]|nr:beta-N-acetylhexosaminidase [Alphaproteobacteria bacterium]HCY47089.1 beta-N-acetylhexosaminidase [Alphaproteobacteria bacterium]